MKRSKFSEKTKKTRPTHKRGSSVNQKKDSLLVKVAPPVNSTTVKSTTPKQTCLILNRSSAYKTVEPAHKSFMQQSLAENEKYQSYMDSNSCGERRFLSSTNSHYSTSEQANQRF